MVIAHVPLGWLKEWIICFNQIISSNNEKEITNPSIVVNELIKTT